jgi:hypothetical protein
VVPWVDSEWFGLFLKRLGQMLQMDGSHHNWFEGRGPWCVLMVHIDDATNFTYARFYEGETMAAVKEIDGQIAICFQGRPLAWRERHPTTWVLQAANIFAAAAGAALPPAAPAAAYFNPAPKRKKGTFLLW